LSEFTGLNRLQDVSTDIADLVTAAPLGFESATTTLERLYVDHRLAVFRFLVSFTSDRTRALDLTAVTYERAFSELRRGRSVGLGWLLRTARNAAIDASRRDHLADRLLRRGSSPARTASSAEDVAMGRDAANRLRAAVNALPSPQREALALRFTTELSVREIGAIVGKGEDATEKLISRALRRLREEFDDFD
jgi:RNA polymerase sigma factor, sigma-70 family